MGKLNDKRVLVTGGGQGLGHAMVQAFMEAGANVAIHYYSSAQGAEHLKEVGAAKNLKAETFQADLTDEKSASAMVERAAKFLGGLDILINNSGDLVQRRRLEELDAEFWARVQSVNVSSMVWVTQAAVPWLQKNSGSSIVNLSSLAGRKGGHPGSVAYSTAKGAVLTWTRSLATELAPKGIRVNAVTPGLILGTRFHQTHTTEESANATISQIPLGRAGNPEDVARAVLFLASEYDGFITGATLDVNGGVYYA